jgi:hypothetical protein
MNSLYFSTNELEDAVFSLQIVSECLRKVKVDSHYWKWAIIALHSSLQGFMVCALRQGTDSQVIESAKSQFVKCPTCSEKIPLPDYRYWGSREEWDRFLTGPKDSNVKPPRPPRLISFMALYKRIKDPRYMYGLGGKTFRPQGTQGNSIKLIGEMRNTFIHFTPKFLSAISLAYLPIVEDVVQVISFLAFESKNILWFGPDDLRSQTKTLVAEINMLTTELEDHYGAELKIEPEANPEFEEWLRMVQQDNGPEED